MMSEMSVMSVVKAQKYEFPYSNKVSMFIRVV